MSFIDTLNGMMLCIRCRQSVLVRNLGTHTLKNRMRHPSYEAAALAHSRDAARAGKDWDCECQDCQAAREDCWTPAEAWLEWARGEQAAGQP